MDIPKTRLECEKIFGENKKLKIVFTKKNGDERTMICSRDSFLIPTMKQATRNGQGGQGNKPPSETNFPVFDLEKADWRAFTISNLISIDVV